MRPLSRLLVLAFCVGLFAPAAVAAAEPATTAAKAAQFRSGTNKIKIGTVLLAAGALLVVADNPPANRRSGTESIVIGAAGIGSGMGLILWGAKQRDNASRPQIAIGATVGKSTAVFITRR